MHDQVCKKKSKAQFWQAYLAACQASVGRSHLLSMLAFAGACKESADPSLASRGRSTKQSGVLNTESGARTMPGLSTQASTSSMLKLRVPVELSSQHTHHVP